MLLVQLGDVPVGEASVLVQVLSAHRKETFEATADIMNKLKSKVHFHLAPALQPFERYKVVLSAHGEEACGVTSATSKLMRKLHVCSP